MEKIFRLIIENVTFPIWIKSLDSKFIFVNDMCLEVHGKTKEEFIGLKNEEIFDASICEIYNKCDNEIIETLKPVIKVINAENGYRQCTIIPLIDENNELIATAGIIGIVTDLGKIKEKELEIEFQKNLTRQIIDILPGVIFYKDNDSKYVYANKECTDFYKAKGIDNIFEKTDAEINFDKILVNKFIADDKKIVESKKPIYNEAIIKDGNGNDCYKEVVKMPLLDDYGNVTGIVGRALDITEKKAYEAKLKYLIYTDILTGTKNRTCFEEREKELCKEKYLPLGIIMGDANGLKLVNDTFGHAEGDKLLIHISNGLKEVCDGIGEVFRMGGDEFVILIPNTTLKYCEDIIKQIIKKFKESENDLFKVSMSLGSSIKADVGNDLYDNFKEAEDKMYRQKLLQKESIKSSVIQSLKIALGAKSAETEQHTERVLISAIELGKKLNLDMSEIDELKIVAELHDIGKIGISEEILLKPGKLTNEEYEMVKTHTEKGYRIIKASSELKNVAEGVLYHHERWDGTGYPIGLKGKEIPLVSRIINVVDSYDVMTTDRVYKKAIGKEEAIEELKRCSGIQFDPEIVEAFIESLEQDSTF